MSDLTTPLGFKAPGSDRKRRPIGLALAILVVALGALIALWIIIIDDPHGGEPVAVATIRDGSESIGREEITVVGVKSGSGEILTPPGTGPATQPMPPEPQETTTLTTMPATTGLPELLEDGAYGPIPQIAADGRRPIEVYGRPVPGLVGAAPRIAIIVGGLGLSQSGTQEALRLLPPDVTLAFAPYGSSLDRWAARARQDGHEILLQVPLEPFDYPDNDPGPHTLITGGGQEKNIDNLHWLMARISAYVGIVTYMGARFTADGSALAPLMQEMTKRGLMFVDEGSSSRSQTREIATKESTAFASADLVIDAVATEADIMSRLSKLEQIARSKGTAVGVASALPISVRHISEWAKTLEPRGITLVPITAALPAPATSP